jgi:branched-chain amino acid aminotransferase
VIAFPLGPPTPAMFDKGVAVAIVSVTRNSPRAIDPAVKSGNYLNNVLALGEARRTSGAYEAILCADDGSVAEGASSNVFTVVRGALWTPGSDVGILDGITRAKAMELARGAGITVVERRILPDELRGADEAFLTSATRGILPVTTIDGGPVGAGVPGPITKRLMVLYDELARRGVE